MGIVKLNSPALEGGETKGNTGTILLVVGGLAVAFLAYRYFQNKKKKEELEKLAHTVQ